MLSVGLKSFAGRLFESQAAAVGHRHSTACGGSWWDGCLPLSLQGAWPAPGSFQSSVVGVTQPVSAVSAEGCADARSRESDRRPGVIHGFQVSEYMVEPRLCVLACNL